MLQSITSKALTRFWQWFEENKKSSWPVYASFDIRLNDHKCVIVDANLFPAGFNNLSKDDWEISSKAWLQALAPWISPSESLLLITEEHTLNLRYWDHVSVLKRLLEKHFKVWLAWPRVVLKSAVVQSASYGNLEVYGAHPEQPVWKNASIKLLLSNNDFSADYGPWMQAWKSVPLIPPEECGWRYRHKARFFQIYNQLAAIAGELLEIDPWHLQIETVPISLSLSDHSNLEQLTQKVHELSETLQTSYQKRGYTYPDTIFIKSARGTYGLGVVPIPNASQFQNLTSHDRKKLKAAKANLNVTEYILQEAISSEYRSESGFKEPVLYFVGRTWVGGFWRVFDNTSHSLVSFNAPGAFFVPEKKAVLEQSPWLQIVGALGLLALEKECQSIDHLTA